MGEGYKYQIYYNSREDTVICSSFIMSSPTCLCILLFIATVVTCIHNNGICPRDIFINKSRKTFLSETNLTQSSLDIGVSDEGWLTKKPESPENMYSTSKLLEVKVGYEGTLNPTCKMIFPKIIFSSKLVQNRITSTPIKPNTFPSHGTVRKLNRHMRRLKKRDNRKERFVCIAASSGTPQVEKYRRRKRQMLAPDIRRRFKTHQKRKEWHIRKSSNVMENRRGRIYRRSRLQKRERNINSAPVDTIPTQSEYRTIRRGSKKLFNEYFGQNVRRSRYNARHNERRSRKTVGRYTYRSRNSKTRRSKSNVERIVRRSNNNRNQNLSRNSIGRIVHNIRNSFSQNLRHLRSNKGRHMYRSRNRINRSVPNSGNSMRRTGHRSRKNGYRTTQRSRNVRIGRVVRHIINSMRRILRHRRVMNRSDTESEKAVILMRRRRKPKLQKSMIEKGINYRRSTQVNRRGSLKKFPIKRGTRRRRFSRVQSYGGCLHSSSACSDRKVVLTDLTFRNEIVFSVNVTKRFIFLVSVNATQNSEECPTRIKHRAKTRRLTRSYRIRKLASGVNSLVPSSRKIQGIELKSTEPFVADNESYIIGPLNAFYELADKIKRFGTKIKEGTPTRSELFAKSNRHVLGILGLTLWMTSRQTSA